MTFLSITIIIYVAVYTVKITNVLRPKQHIYIYILFVVPGYSASPGGLVQPYKPQIPEAVYEPTTSGPVARDLQSTRERTHSSDSAESTDSATSSHTTDSGGSGHSGDPLLQAHPVVYTQVDVKQPQVPPPVSDDHVQYTQLKH